MNGAKVVHKSGQNPPSAVNFAQGKSLPCFKIVLQSVSCFVPRANSVKPARERTALFYAFSVLMRPAGLRYLVVLNKWNTALGVSSGRWKLLRLSGVLCGGYTAPAWRAALWVWGLLEGDSWEYFKTKGLACKERGGCPRLSCPLMLCARGVIFGSWFVLCLCLL